MGVQESQEKCGQVIVNVTSGDLYSAIDEYVETSLDSYKTPRGHHTTAEKNVWFTHLPEVVSFQLQRVYYDAKTQQALKNNAPFQFDDLIYLDRYMGEHREEILRRRGVLKDLRFRRKETANELQKFTNYQGLGVALDLSLQAACAYMKDGGCQSPEVLQLLSDASAHVGIKMAQLRQTISQIDQEITSLFADLRQYAYQLQAVLVHDGKSAGQGHYWAYVRQPEHDQWLQYNDINVSIVDEKEVWERSVGGSGNCSAYFLLYSRYNPELSREDLSADRMTELIPAQLQAHVADVNASFEKEIEQYTAKKRQRNCDDKVNKIVSQFERSEQELIQNATKKIEYGTDFRLKDLSVFLYRLDQNRLARYHLFQQAVKKICTPAAQPAQPDPMESSLEEVYTALLAKSRQPAAPGMPRMSATAEIIQPNPQFDQDIERYQTMFDAFRDNVNPIVAALRCVLANRHDEAFRNLLFALQNNPAEPASLSRRDEILFYFRVTLMLVFQQQQAVLMEEKSAEEARADAFVKLESLGNLALSVLKSDSDGVISFLREKWIDTVAQLESRPDIDQERLSSVVAKWMDVEGSPEVPLAPALFLPQEIAESDPNFPKEIDDAYHKVAEDALKNYRTVCNKVVDLLRDAARMQI
eukprot:TRINITY_DN5439_c0_g2_i8.p1 TRINITY_DN5439_c0_g2~~TRINITY_DN5439_c0_g2_i8.p1  ORF type:complete len:652 (-),score=263.98 TRINITY_DN5439_c0_g2_i8:171-2096(-)